MVPCKSSWAIAKVSWLGLGGSGCMGSPMWCRNVHGSGPSGDGLGDFGEGLGVGPIATMGSVSDPGSQSSQWLGISMALAKQFMI